LSGNSGTLGWRPIASRVAPLDLARIHERAAADRRASLAPVRPRTHPNYRSTI
jgi:hypothetical protein